MGQALRTGLCGTLLGLVLSVPAPVSADYIEDVAVGTATVAANVFYVPAKLAYAALGGITGGFAYVLTGANYQVAERVWNPSLGGDYILNRSHIQGEETIYFSAPIPSAGNMLMTPAARTLAPSIEPSRTAQLSR